MTETTPGQGPNIDEIKSLKDSDQSNLLSHLLKRMEILSREPQLAPIESLGVNPDLFPILAEQEKRVSSQLRPLEGQRKIMNRTLAALIHQARDLDPDIPFTVADPTLFALGNSEEVEGDLDALKRQHQTDNPRDTFYLLRGISNNERTRYLTTWWNMTKDDPINHGAYSSNVHEMLRDLPPTFTDPNMSYSQVAPIYLTHFANMYMTKMLQEKDRTPDQVTSAYKDTAATFSALQQAMEATSGVKILHPGNVIGRTRQQVLDTLHITEKQAQEFNLPLFRGRINEPIGIYDHVSCVPQVFTNTYGVASLMAPASSISINFPAELFPRLSEYPLHTP